MHPPVIEEERESTSCAHAVSFQPIIPIHLLQQSVRQQTFSSKGEHADVLAERLAREKYPEIFQTSNALSACPAPPSWNPVPTAYREPLLERQGPGETIILLDPPPVSSWSNRRRTMQSVLSTPNTAFVTGDCGGGVTVYDSYSGRCRPIALIRTAAWSREQKRSLTSRKVISWPNSIDYISWTDSVLIWASNREIEIFDTSSLSKPMQISRTRILHLQEKVGSVRLCRLSVRTSSLSWNVLWTTGGLALIDQGLEENSCNLNTIELKMEDCGGKTPPSSTKVSPVTPCGVDDFECVVAIWDAFQPEPTQASASPIALILAWTSATTVELLRCRTESGEILQRVNCWTWPKHENSTKLADLHLQQSEDSRFLFTLGFGGIRVHESSTLQCMQVFGESVSLHGKTVQWIGCQWVRAPGINCNPSGNVYEVSVVKQKKDSWVECLDPVSLRTGSDSDEYWLVGLPHPSKGPDELRSNIHVWKLGYATAVAVLHAPAGGLLGVCINSNSGFGWSMVGAPPNNGRVLEWSSRIQSSFAGAMYPVNYHVIDDNIEYFEKEDELDELGFFEDARPITVNPTKEHPRSKRARLQEETDDELARALQLSLAEQLERTPNSSPSHGLISVLADQDNKGLFHSKPDPSLLEFQGNADQCPSSPESPIRKRGPSNAIFASFPQYKQAHQAYNQMRQDQLQLLPSEVPTTDVTIVSKSKMKRSRQANLEALLQTSIKPDLRSVVESAQAKWGTGHGSSLEESILTSRSLNRPYQTPNSDQQTRNESAKPESTFNAPTIETAPLNIPLQSNPSPVEKELALELLLLSPGKSGTSGPDASLVAQQIQQSMPCPFKAEETVVTPSEDEKVEAISETAISETRSCAACEGRLVIHTCGKREKPVDYEALEEVERERKKKEKEEKERDRAEKRRAADTRRRQARKQKKLEEEKQRQVEERLRFAQCQADTLSSRDALGSFDGDKVPVAKVSSEHAVVHVNLEESDSTANRGNQEWSTQSVRKEAPSNVSPSRLSFSIDGNEVKPSTSLSSADALSALAGLAECMPIAATPNPQQPTMISQSSAAFPPAPSSWHGTSPETSDGKN